MFFTSVFALFALLMLSSCARRTTVVHHHQPAPTRVVVETWSDEVSYNLDLRAVASIFADSRSLQEFEMRLNDPRLGISNLDLNRDGFVDYLRVIEVFERGTRVIVIQAVLGFNMFQDVATIVVDGRNARSATVQVIGNPFIFGRNYIIQPVFHRQPVIFTSFWAPHPVIWHSPFHWGHFPPTFVQRPIVVTNVYITNIRVNNVINVNNRFIYQNTVRNQNTVNRMQNTVGRNDFARSNPSQSFDNRNANANIRNTRDVQTRDINAATRQATQQPATRQATTQPANNQPATRQATTQPANNQPATRQATTQPTNNQPATRQATTQPANNQPATRQATTQPANNQPATRQATTQPANNQPATRQTTTQPATNQPATRQATTQPANNQPATRQATTQPANNQPATRQATTQQAPTQQREPTARQTRRAENQAAREANNNSRR